MTNIHRLNKLCQLPNGFIRFLNTVLRVTEMLIVWGFKGNFYHQQILYRSIYILLSVWPVCSHTLWSSEIYPVWRREFFPPSPYSSHCYLTTHPDSYLPLFVIQSLKLLLHPSFLLLPPPTHTLLELSVVIIANHKSFFVGCGGGTPVLL